MTVFLVSIGAWSFIAGSSALSLYEFNRSLGHPFNMRMEITVPLINFCIYAVLSPIVFLLAQRYPFQRNDWQRRVLLYFGGGVAFSVAHVALRALYPVWNPQADGYTSALWDSRTHAFKLSWLLLRRLFLYDVTDDIASTYLAIVLVAHAVLYYRNFREREIRATQLESQLTKARLTVLKTQMQPHFLFNTMHSISALILTDVSAADKMITRLSDFLRISLANNDVQFTTLGRELEFVNAYLEIEKIRFEERLTVVFDAPADHLDLQVPHLILQPLVENAVRHGISKRRAGGQVRITSETQDGRLCITVSDNGPGLEAAEQDRFDGGLGLTATQERLRTIYGENQGLTIRALAEGGVEVEMLVPIREGADSELKMEEDGMKVRA